jgi:hypothetical protein
MRGDLILESLVLPKIALLILQCEVSHFPARGASFLFPKTRSYSTNCLNQTRQHFHIIFLIHLTWWNIFFMNGSLTVKKNLTNITSFDFLNKNLLCLEELGEGHSVPCLFVWGSYCKHQVSRGIILKTQVS